MSPEFPVALFQEDGKVLLQACYTTTWTFAFLKNLQKKGGKGRCGSVQFLGKKKPIGWVHPGLKSPTLGVKEQKKKRERRRVPQRTSCEREKGIEPPGAPFEKC